MGRNSATYTDATRLSVEAIPIDLRVCNAISHNASLNVFLLASLLVHIGIALLLYLNRADTVLPVATPVDTIIRAKVVFRTVIPPPAQVEIDPVNQAVSNQDNASEGSQIQQKSRQDVSDLTEAPAPITDPVPDEQRVAAPDTKTAVVPRGLSGRDLASHHLRDINRSAQDKLAQSQAKQFRQQRVSPNLQIPQYDRFTSEEEKLLEQITTRVDCSSGVNKSFALLATLTGGRVKCSEPSDLAPFIDNRLNKLSAKGEK